MRAQEYLRRFRRSLVLVLSFVIIGLSAGVVLAISTPPRYTASTELFISAQFAADAPSVERSGARDYARQSVDSYAGLMTSSLVLDPVIHELWLDTTAQQLSSSITATGAANSPAITVTVSDENPGQAALIANAIGRSFTTVVAQRLERPIGARPGIVRIDTLESAQVPVRPSAPDSALIILLGGAAGLVAGLLVAAIRAARDDRIRTQAEAEEAVDEAVLGRIVTPRSSTRLRSTAGSAMALRAEAVRELRTNVEHVIGGARASLVFTSATGEADSAATASDLAIAFADTGRRVALVDADLRRPTIAHRLGLDGDLGLTDVLTGRSRLSDAVQRWGAHNLFVLAAGAVPANPGELVSSAAMAEALDDLRAVFDVVIIDAPPAALVSDAAQLARQSDGVILVIATRISRMARVRDTVHRIDRAGVAVVGAVMTGAPAAGRGARARRTSRRHGVVPTPMRTPEEINA